jgi:hypothetical protein
MNFIVIPQPTTQPMLWDPRGIQVLKDLIAIRQIYLCWNWWYIWWSAGVYHCLICLSTFIYCFFCYNFQAGYWISGKIDDLVMHTLYGSIPTGNELKNGLAQLKKKAPPCTEVPQQDPQPSVVCRTINHKHPVFRIETDRNCSKSSPGRKTLQLPLPSSKSFLLLSSSLTSTIWQRDWNGQSLVASFSNT